MTLTVITFVVAQAGAETGAIMEFSRRTLFGASAAVGVGLLLPPLRLATVANAAVPTGVTPFTEPLPTLADLGFIDATGGGSATISMVNATHKFHTALAATPTFAYQGVKGATRNDQNYLGPVIVAKQGTPFDLVVQNNLGVHPLASAIDTSVGGALSTDGTSPRASTHLHGGNTAAGMDGDPTATFTPHNSFSYHYDNTQEAAGIWYHDHALGITRLNVFAGLAGGYLIRNADDDGLGIKLPAPPYEVPLIIQDRSFKADGTFDYPPAPWTPEFFGDVATVNGKAWPNLDVNRGKYRFRVYNGSNARVYNLRFLNGLNSLTFHQIGSDGGLLNAPVPLNQLLLAPGERADLVVDFAGLRPGATITLFNGAVAPYPTGPRLRRRGGAPLYRIMQFTVTSAAGWTKPIPAKLRAAPITRFTPAMATGNGGVPRTMDLVEIHNTAGDPLMVLLNNRNFNPDGANLDNIHVRTNTLEQWEIINTTVDAHPIHLHFTQFQVLNRQTFNATSYLAAAYPDQVLLAPNTGNVPPPPVTPFLNGGTKPPAANELGWKDTVLATPGEVTRILVPFGASIPGFNPAGEGPGPFTAFQASHIGNYVWHCHILEHEDNDMMQRYVIS